MTLDKAVIRRQIVPAALIVLIAVWGYTASGTWPFVGITAVWQGLIILSAGMLFERVGLLSLCPLTFAGVSTYVVILMTQTHQLAMPLMIAAAVLAVIPVGAFIGALALRLRGVNLAVATFAFAVTMSGFLDIIGFPSQFAFDRKALQRPSALASDKSMFLFCLALLVIVGVALNWYGRSARGRAWLVVRSSERACLAAGRSVAAAKLEAFVISAAIAGLGGALAAYQTLGSVATTTFDPVSSITLVATAVMVGAGSLSGAILGGFFVAVVPTFLNEHGVPTTYLSMAFGVGAAISLTKDAGGITAALPWRRARRPQPASSPVPTVVPVAGDPMGPTEALRKSRARPDAVSPLALEVRDITVRYGKVTALSRVSLSVPAGSVSAVIGPNGAGKSTLIDVVAGFVPGYEGAILVGGSPLDRLPAHRRARAGVRRTFQTCRAVPELTLGGYMSVFAQGSLTPERRDELIDLLELPPAEEPIAFVDVGTRRVIEIAACLAAHPQVVLLDEPAAGLGEEQSVRLGQQIKRIPDLFGCSVVLVEHDVDLVAATATHLTVLDFGQVIAQGDPVTVLHDPAVTAAYLGDDELFDSELPTTADPGARDPDHAQARGHANGGGCSPAISLPQQTQQTPR